VEELRRLRSSMSHTLSLWLNTCGWNCLRGSKMAGKGQLADNSMAAEPAQKPQAIPAHDEHR